MNRQKPDGNRSAMTVSEAGRKGGNLVRDTRGGSFYREIGKKGGNTVMSKRSRPP
jgi:uncharacterized protein